MSLNKMEYEIWEKLKRAMAIEAYCMDAADAMVPYAIAKVNAEDIAKYSESNVDQANARVQRWRALDHYMGNALIALEQLGYKIEPV